MTGERAGCWLAFGGGEIIRFWCLGFGDGFFPGCPAAPGGGPCGPYEGAMRAGGVRLPAPEEVPADSQNLEWPGQSRGADSPLPAPGELGCDVTLHTAKDSVVNVTPEGQLELGVGRAPG